MSRWWGGKEVEGMIPTRPGAEVGDTIAQRGVLMRMKDRVSEVGIRPYLRQGWEKATGE